jgi:tetratricopeptide (TPR) repeat protein
MNTGEWFIKASAYFDGSMTGEEARAFEEATAASDELNELMLLWTRTDEEAAAYEQCKPVAKALINTHQRLKMEFIGAPSRVVKFPLWKWVAAAAVITGLSIIANMLLPVRLKNPAVVQKTTSDTQKNVENPNRVKDKLPEKNLRLLDTLYAQNFTADDVPEDPNGPLDNAYFYYASRQYKRAIIAIDSAGTKQLTRGGEAFSTSTKVYATYYKALSLMSLGKVDSASALLRQTIQGNNPQTLKVKAQWYLALAYINKHERSLAIDMLESLIADPGTNLYKRKARKLLSELKDQ